MEKFKGKPGPWHWEGKVLCNDAHIVGGDGWAFNDADKKLIAAAPELLEALQNLISGYEDMSGHGMFDMLCHGDEIEAANAAIKKALGE